MSSDEEDNEENEYDNFGIGFGGSLNKEKITEELKNAMFILITVSIVYL